MSRNEKIGLVVMLIVVALLFVAGAKASRSSTPAPELQPEASLIAHKPLQVRCYANDGVDPDSDQNTWGYTYLAHPVIYLDPTVCEGALALLRGEMKPLWELAIGAWVLTHESYHQGVFLPFWRRQSEAQTECRAIKRVPKTLIEMGASPELADVILPWALAEHYKLETIDSDYNYPSCAVPVFKDFWR